MDRELTITWTGLSTKASGLTTRERARVSCALTTGASTMVTGRMARCMGGVSTCWRILASSMRASGARGRSMAKVWSIGRIAPLLKAYGRME